MRLFKITSFFIILTLYFLNIFSILRLNVDVFRYFSIVEYLDGNKMYSFAKNDFYPHGYPQLLRLLIFFKILNQQSITIINIFAVFIGSFFYFKVFEIKKNSIFLILILLNWVIIKHFTLAVPDIIFMALSAIIIYLFKKLIINFNIILFSIVVIFIIFCIYLRTAGIFLPASFILYYLIKYLQLVKRYQLYLIIIFIISAIFIFYFNLDYLEFKFSYIKQLNLNSLFLTNDANIINRLAIHFRELGEVILNIGTSKLEYLIGPMLAKFILITIGLFFSSYALYFIHLNKYHNHFLFYPFLLYFIMIFLWPFYDSRFFIPIIPLILMFIKKVFENKYLIKFKSFYLLIYLLVGIVSLSYSTYFSLNKDIFINKYGNNVNLRNNYKYVFKNNTTLNVDSNFTFILKKYN